MKLRKRLTILSSITFGVIFLIASTIIYGLFYKTNETSVIKNLKKTALVTGIYYLEKDEQSLQEHNNIRREFENLISRDDIAVFDEFDEVAYGKMVNDSVIRPFDLNQVRKKKEHVINTRNDFYYGLYYADNQGDFVVFVKENKDVFNTLMNRLLYILVIVLVLGLFIIYLLSRFLGNMAYEPIQKIIDQVRQKEIDRLNEPIRLQQSYSEIQELVETYNDLMAKASETFVIQKNFINYVSHEFRTPLAAISGSLEVFSQKDRTPEEYQEVASRSIERVKELEEILNNMLLLSGAINSKDFMFFRIDEIIWNIVEEVTVSLKAHIHVDFKVENVGLLSVKGNEKQLQLALYNLIENGLKYSENKPLSISLSEKENKLHLVIKDEGIGIDENDLPYIQQTFYRGKNVGDIKGSGIGLSLASTIFKIHQIDFKIITSNQGTEIHLQFNPPLF
ncbi:HAMP domain-containing sensor histidine kinase [Myroides ceti]|uniref:histidine kinase n=1 Tax=Paenimyroides ceti TaxID=395087 RepID=A0ABT8CM49_9FLAO|nr:HAMP domain-containing sensor histidine kinase [Paenimyroides ceti]MDN3705602.1 HAMP domain-containing sensor histidine kinase [Paenimyroides ceti]